MTEVLTTHEVADILQCEPKTVEDKLRAGELPGVKIGVSWMCPRVALLETLNELARKNVGARPVSTPHIPRPAGRPRKQAPRLT